jgi:hypothetical protein
MVNLRTFVGAVVCFAAMASGAAAQTTVDALKLVPASADAFAVVPKIADLDKKIGAVATKMGMPGIGVLDLAKKMLGIEEGIDKNGSAVAMVFFPVAEPAAVVLAIPVTNFEAVAKGLNAKDPEDGIHEFDAVGKEMVLAKKGKFALAAPADCREHLVKVLKEEVGNTNRVKSLERWLGTQDVALVALDNAVKEFAKKGFETIPEDLPGLPEDQAMAVKAQLEMVRNFLKRGSEELTHAAIGLGIDSEANAKLSINVGFTKGGSFSKWGQTLPKENPLMGLPSGGYIFAGGYAMSPETMQKMMTFAASSSKGAYNLSEEDAKELEKVWAGSAKGVRGMAFGFTPPPEGTGMFEGMVGVFRVDSSKEYLKLWRDAAEKGNKILQIESQVKPVKVGKFEAFEAVTDVKSLLKNNPDPMAEEMVKKFLGGAEKVTVTAVAVNANTIIFGYVPTAKMKLIAESYAKLPMLAAAAPVAKTMKQFPANPFMITLVNPKGVVELVEKMAKEFGKELPISAMGNTSPIGMAAASDATSFQFVLVVPGDVFAEAGKIIQKHAPGQ